MKLDAGIPTDYAEALQPGQFGKMAGTKSDRNLGATRLPPKGKTGDRVILPHHYARFKIEPVRFIGENNLNFFQGNVVKYILRHDAKNGLEDVKKAIRYAKMYYEYLAGNPDWWGPDVEELRSRRQLVQLCEAIREILMGIADTKVRSEALSKFTLAEARIVYNAPRGEEQRPA